MLKIYLHSKVVCIDPNATIIANKQAFTPGQIMDFPAPHGAVKILQCQSGYNWIDGSTRKNITCYVNKWTSFPPPCVSKLDFHYFIN